MKYVYLSLIIFSLVTVSCKKGKEMKTDSGFKYILHSDSGGVKPKIGDYVTIKLSYKNDNDSVLFDWSKTGSPIRFQLEKIPFKGSFEDGLTYIGEKDSATFYVPADSLYKQYFSHTGKPQSATAFLPGSFLRFNIKLLKVQTPAQAEEEMLLSQIAMEEEERKIINDYIGKNNISVSPDTAGYYLIIKEKGKGERVDSGKVITVEYEGRFLNDSVFDGTKLTGKPYQFISGAQRVIPGWERALKNLNAGDKITLLVPSKLAYGAEGIREEGSVSFLVPPNTPLIFDIDILRVEEMPAVSGR